MMPNKVIKGQMVLFIAAITKRAKTSIAAALLLCVTAQYVNAQWSANGNNTYLTNQNGFVGIGVQNPIRNLHIKDYSGTVGFPRIYMEGTAGVSSPGIIFAFDSTDTRRSIIRTYPEGGLGTNLEFFTKPDSGTATSSRMIITSAGRVGIGNTLPQAMLHVSGDVQVDGNIVASGNIAAKYQDLAEWVSADVPIEAGSVVITDPSKPDHVLPSFKEYDTRVAGVVSSTPGIVLGVEGEGKVKVATTGRVKVKVDASKGAIEIGDLLVSGEIAGIARRSEPLELGGIKLHRPGTLIGKALEPLNSGTGEIMVLLSLQ